jgi:TolA-binding protein
MLGWSCHDVRTAVNAGKSEIETSVRDGKADIEAAKQPIPGLKDQVNQLQSDIAKYQQVNQHINDLQKQLTKVQNDVIDLGNHALKVKSIQTTGPGSPSIGFGPQIGCPLSAVAPSTVAYCAEGSPPSLFQITSTGEKRPVSSLSPIGFRDTSTTGKSACSAANRGTFYVEKGAGNVPDKPFLCARKSDNTYGWIQLSTVP